MKNRLFKTRRGTIAVSAITALVAALLLVLYLRSYRSSVNAGTLPERVLVAKRLIPRGTAGSVITQKVLYAVTTVPKDQLEPLAISDPSTISGQVASADIFAGQQLTASDFTGQDASSLNYQLTGPQRAIAIPVDTLHGLQPELTAGDFVDVYVSIAGTNGSSTAKAASGTSTAALASTQVRLLARNILVLATPASGTTSNTIVRVNTGEVARFAYVADYERFWLVLRPQAGATPTPPSVAPLGSLLQGGG